MDLVKCFHSVRGFGVGGFVGIIISQADEGVKTKFQLLTNRTLFSEISQGLSDSVFALASLVGLCYNSIAMKDAKTDSSIKTITVNRKARHDYHLGERYETGIVLQGTEVKSIRAGRLNLTDSYARIKNGEVFLIDAHISPYEYGNLENHEPKRQRKLLLHRREIRKIEAKTRPSGTTIVPTKAYFSNGRIKLEIALARGKHEYDQREDIQKEEAERAIRSYLKERNR